MKRYVGLLVVILLVLIGGCKKDDTTKSSLRIKKIVREEVEDSKKLVNEYSFIYTTNGLLDKVTDGEGNIDSYIYNSNGRLQQVDYYDAVDETTYSVFYEWENNTAILMYGDNQNYREQYYFDGSMQLTRIEERYLVDQTWIAAFVCDLDWEAGNLMKETWSYSEVVNQAPRYTSKLSNIKLKVLAAQNTKAEVVFLKSASINFKPMYTVDYLYDKMNNPYADFEYARINGAFASKNNLIRETYTYNQSGIVEVYNYTYLYNKSQFPKQQKETWDIVGDYNLSAFTYEAL